jgi:hypothetical protein
MKHQFGHRSGSGDYQDVSWGENAETYGSPIIKKSSIAGGKVFGGYIENSKLFNEVIVSGSPAITDSIVMHRAIVSDHAKCRNSILTDESRLIDYAMVNHVIMKEFAVIGGKAVVVGVHDERLVIGSYMNIDRGVWFKAPMHFVCSSGFVVTESIDNLVNVSCTTNTIEKWLGGAGRRYGKLVGLDEKQSDEIIGYIEEIRDFKQQNKSPRKTSG